ncbi:MAG: hypothetical protein QRY71_03705 [Candidatus Rhabdochlamydia sp.]
MKTRYERESFSEKIHAFCMERKGVFFLLRKHYLKMLPLSFNKNEEVKIEMRR